MDRAVQAIESIAALAIHDGERAFSAHAKTYTLKNGDKVEICNYTQSVQVQFSNLWAYYAPGRKVSYQEGDEELLVEVSRSLDEGTFFAF